MTEPGTKWETAERDDDIVGWKITLSGHRGSFHVLDQHLVDTGMTLTQFINWLRERYPHREVDLDS